MKLTVDDEGVKVALSPYEKLGGLRSDIELPYDRIEAAEVDPEPMSSIRFKLKVGLRIPGRHYVCSTDWGRKVWVLHGRGPALMLRLKDGHARQVTVSADDAQALAERISARIAA